MGTPRPETFLWRFRKNFWAASSPTLGDIFVQHFVQHVSHNSLGHTLHNTPHNVLKFFVGVLGLPQRGYEFHHSGKKCMGVLKQKKRTWEETIAAEICVKCSHE